MGTRLPLQNKAISRLGPAKFPRGGISGKGRRDCCGTLAPMTKLTAFIRLIARRFLSGRVFGGWASGGETFTRFLPHTPSSNAPHSPALVAAIVNKVGRTDGLERVVRPASPWCA